MLRRFGRDVAIYGGADFLFKLVQFAALPIYSHRLSVSQFGLLALLQVSAVLLGVVANMGVSYALQRFYFDKDVPEPRRPVLVSTALAQLLATTIVICAAAALLLHLFSAQLEGRYGIGWALAALALASVVPDQISQFTLDTARLQFAPGRFCLIALIKNLLGLLIGLWLLIALNMGLVGLLVGTLAGNVIAVPVGLLLVRRDFTLWFDPAYQRVMFRFGAPFVFTAAAYWAFGSLDRWLLANLSDSVQVGLFSIALKLASAVTLVTAAFQQAWVPTGLRMARDEPNYRQTFSAILSLWFYVLALIALGLGLFAGELLRLVAPPAYWPAAAALAIGAAAIALSGTTQVTGMALTIEKRSGLVALGAWLTALVNVGGNLVLIPRLGATGAAIATLLCYGFLTFYYLWWGQRLHPIPLERGRLAFGALVLGAGVAAVALPAAGSLFDPLIAVKLGIFGAASLGAVAAGLVRPRLLREMILQPRKSSA